MRMRKKKWAQPFVQENEKFMINDPSINKGHWHDVLNKQDLCLEIGIGKGNYIKGMAANNPELGFIGIEKDTNCVAVALKTMDVELANIKLINKDASNLNEWFDEAEISRIYLNFSDPWPKKGHTKRRLSSNVFIAEYLKILKDDGYIIMKTDNQKLFEYSVVSFLDCGLKLIELSVNFDSQANGDVVTEYEQRFLDLGQPIYRMVLQKQGGNCCESC